MMESVEDIPAEPIIDRPAVGLGDLRRVPRPARPHAQGHQRRRHGRATAPSRFYAMGERSHRPDAHADAPTSCERMRARRGGDGGRRARLLDLAHAAPPGARRAAACRAPAPLPDELLACRDVLRPARPAACSRSAPRFDDRQDGVWDQGAESEVALDGGAARRTGRPLTFGFVQTRAGRTQYRKLMRVRRARGQRGGRGHAAPDDARGIGVLFGVAHRTPFDAHPAWKALREPAARRAAGRAARPAAAAAELVAEAEANGRSRRPRGLLRADRADAPTTGPTRRTRWPAIAAAAGRHAGRGLPRSRARDRGPGAAVS